MRITNIAVFFGWMREAVERTLDICMYRVDMAMNISLDDLPSDSYAKMKSFQAQ